MSKKIMQRSLNALKYHQEQTRPIHNTIETIAALEAELAKIEKKEKSNGCKKKLASGQWWHHCGDTDFGSMPALCTECGGDLKLEEV